MNQKLIVTSTAFLFLVVSVPALAQDVTPTPTISLTPTSFQGKWFRGLGRFIDFNRKDKEQDRDSERQERKRQDRDDNDDNRKKVRPSISLTPTPLVDQATRRLNSAQKLGDNLYDNFKKRSSNLIEIQTRIQARLTAKATTLGVDKLASAQVSLDAVKPLFDKFNSDLTLFKTSVDNLVTAPDLKIALSALKVQAKTVQQDLQNIQQGLVSALRLVVTAH